MRPGLLMASDAPALDHPFGGADPAGPGLPAVPGEAAQIWRRLRSDRLAVVCGAFLVLVLVLCFIVEPILRHVLGHGPDDYFPYGAGVDLKPVPPWSWVPSQHSVLPAPTAHSDRTFFLLGADGPLGRDELLRLLAGGRVSLTIGIGAAIVSLLIGVTAGAFAGYRGGTVDAVVSRATELVMAFPLLLLLIAMGQTIGARIDAITLGGVFAPGVLTLILVIGAFTWFYPARVVRSLVVSLREREFVDAARSIGASDRRIVRTHLVPHLAGPVLVWGTLITATNIVLESAISFLNLGIKLPTASWGNMISTNWGTLLAFNPTASFAAKTNWTLVWPTAALLLTVLALTLFGESLRAAVDPRSEV
jgi:peptide/nickel transport system permease protein